VLLLNHSLWINSWLQRLLLHWILWNNTRRLQYLTHWLPQLLWKLCSRWKLGRVLWLTNRLWINCWLQRLLLHWILWNNTRLQQLAHWLPWLLWLLRIRRKMSGMLWLTKRLRIDCWLQRLLLHCMNRMQQLAHWLPWLFWLLHSWWKLGRRLCLWIDCRLQRHLLLHWILRNNSRLRHWGHWLPWLF